jgi:hypothetical protein
MYINNQPHVVNIGHKKWRLVKKHPIYFKYKNSWWRLDIEAGFEYDLSSIPRIAWTILGKANAGQLDNGSTFHDLPYMLPKNKNKNAILGKDEYECSHQLYCLIGDEWVRSELEINRKYADKIMFDVIDTTKKVKVKPRTLKIIHSFIRLGGWLYWRKSTPLEKINPSRCRI